MSLYEGKSQRHCQRGTLLPLFFDLKINKNKRFNSIALFPYSNGNNFPSYDQMKLKLYFKRNLCVYVVLSDLWNQVDYHCAR